MEEAISRGLLPRFDPESPLMLDMRGLPPTVAEVYVLHMLVTLERHANRRAASAAADMKRHMSEKEGGLSAPKEATKQVGLVGLARVQRGRATCGTLVARCCCCMPVCGMRPCWCAAASEDGRVGGTATLEVLHAWAMAVPQQQLLPPSTSLHLPCLSCNNSLPQPAGVPQQHDAPGAAV